MKCDGHLSNPLMGRRTPGSSELPRVLVVLRRPSRGLGCLTSCHPTTCKCNKQIRLPIQTGETVRRTCHIPPFLAGEFVTAKLLWHILSKNAREFAYVQQDLSKKGTPSGVPFLWGGVRSSKDHHTGAHKAISAAPLVVGHPFRLGGSGLL